jgi:hypothetical protein
MTQNFSNFGQSTLSSTITNVATSLVVASMASFKDHTGATIAPPFVIQVDSELMNVTGVAGTTLTITRAAEGTAAASHTAGAIVKTVVSAGGLQNLVRLEHIGTGTPTGGSSGDMKVATGKLWVNDGGTWKSVPIVVPTSPPAADYYIAPTGNDTTGSGTIGSPWRTIQKFLTVAQPGNLLYVRGGTYQGTDIGGIVTSNKKGTQSAWITIRAYPGEVPIFAGGGTTPNNFFWNFRESGTGTGSQYIDIDGLRFTGWKVTDTGVFTSSALATSLVHHIRLHNIIGDMGDNASANSHFFYAGQNVHDWEIDNNFVDGKIDVYGTSRNGRGMQIYHTDGADRINVHHNYFKGWTGGVLVNDANANTITIDHNTFADCFNNIQIESAGTQMVVTNNAGENGLSLNIYNPVGAIDVNSNNVWGLIVPTHLTTAGLLTATSPARGADSTGGDAGWKPYV